MFWDLKEPECISKARLMIASPEFVFEQLRYYGENTQRWGGKKDLEKSILKRNDKLINLALAQHSTQKEIILELYNRASDPHGDETYNLGVRVACLSNRHFNYFNWPDFDLEEIITKGVKDETYALLRNPTIKDDILESLFKKTNWFASLSEDDWMHMIMISAENDKLNIDESNDSGPDMGLYRIHQAIFSFLETAPVTPRSVHAASNLLNALQPEHCAWPNEISHVLERWRSVDVKNYKGEETEGWSTHLPLKEELACLIGSLYGHRSTTQKGKPAIFGSAADEDIALRCAFYACGRLNEKDITVGYEKDNDVFLFAALKNSALYLNKKTRAILEDYISGNFRHAYKHRCEQLQKKHKWFDARPTTETGRDVMEDLVPQVGREITLLENINRQSTLIISRVMAYERKLYWAAFIIIAVIYFLRK